MEPDEPVRAAGGRRHGPDRETRSVGGEDRVGRAQAIEGTPELGLEAEAFGDGLNDEIAAREVLQVNREAEVAQGTIPGPGLELSLLDQLVERLLDRPLALGEETGLDVADRRRVAGRCGRLSDAAAHLAAAEHADVGDFTHGASGDWPLAAPVIHPARSEGPCPGMARERLARSLAALGM